MEPTDLAGRARWSGSGAGLSFQLSRGMRDVLLGADPTGVHASRRGKAALAELREAHTSHVTADGTVLHRESNGDVHWWTWAGSAANRTLHASLGGLVDPAQRIGDESVRFGQGIDLRDAARRLSQVDHLALRRPPVDERALVGLKFSSALPVELARSTVAERIGDTHSAAAVLDEPLLMLATERGNATG